MTIIIVIIAAILIPTIAVMMVRGAVGLVLPERMAPQIDRAFHRAGRLFNQMLLLAFVVFVVAFTYFIWTESPEPVASADEKPPAAKPFKLCDDGDHACVFALYHGAKLRMIESIKHYRNEEDLAARSIHAGDPQSGALVQSDLADYSHPTITMFPRSKIADAGIPMADWDALFTCREATSDFDSMISFIGDDAAEVEKDRLQYIEDVADCEKQFHLRPVSTKLRH